MFWKDVLRDRVIDQSRFGAHSEDLASGLDWWARACCGHHGQPPTEGDHWRQHFDPQEVRTAALAFADAMRQQFISAELAEAITQQDPHVFLAASAELSWWLAGLAVLADWLGSNTLYFAYQDQPQALANYWIQARGQAATALAASGVLPAPSADTLPFGALFS